jgi:hypothetical protein
MDMRTRTISFPEAYLQMKSGKAVRLKGWSDKALILVPAKKLYRGTVEHPLLKSYIERMDGHDVGFEVAERYQLVYSPSDEKTICSDEIVGPHLIDDYKLTAAEMGSLNWITQDFI